MSGTQPKPTEEVVLTTSTPNHATSALQKHTPTPPVPVINMVDKLEKQAEASSSLFNAYVKYNRIYHNL